MIRINLLGHARPKVRREPVHIESTLQIVFFLASMILAGGFMYFHWYSMQQQTLKLNAHIRMQSGEKARLERLKTEVENFEKQKAVLQERISVIEELQHNRTGGQELLNALANTVVRTDTLWLTSLQRTGDGLTIQGTAGSINAVANFITELKSSGYFDQVEIKESQQDTTNVAVETFNFTLTAQFSAPGPKSAPPAGKS